MGLHIFLIRILVAFVSGVLIGAERQWHKKSAGVRTAALTSIGSAIFVLLSYFVTPSNGDVTRIIAQVVTGVGFLGAGVIFKDGFTVRGLNTSVTIWCSSGIGCLAGAGFYLEALSASVLVVFINAGLRWIDNWLSKEADEFQEESDKQ